MRADWTARFTETFCGPVSPTSARIWGEVYGDEYPASVDAHSYVSRSELTRLAEESRLRPDELLADVGCGRGGPGLWVAAQRQARVVGVDVAATALDAAQDRAAALGLGGRTDYRLGSFAETGLPGGFVNAVLSIDALLFAQDKAAALRELGRIATPGGRLLLTTWDYGSTPEGRPPQVSDHRPLLEAAGYEVEAYEETENWFERQLRTTDLCIEAADELAAETGRDAEHVRASLREMRASMFHMTRRVLITATRVSSPRT